MTLKSYLIGLRVRHTPLEWSETLGNFGLEQVRKLAWINYGEFQLKSSGSHFP